jgi:hypothetical protein
VGGGRLAGVFPEANQVLFARSERHRVHVSRMDLWHGGYIAFLYSGGIRIQVLSVLPFLYFCFGIILGPVFEMGGGSIWPCVLMACGIQRSTSRVLLRVWSRIRVGFVPLRTDLCGSRRRIFLVGGDPPKSRATSGISSGWPHALALGVQLCESGLVHKTKFPPLVLFRC